MIYVRQSTRVSNQGIGFLGLLTIVFVIAKLTGFVAWSWWFVFLPVYVIPAVLLSVGALGLGIWSLVQVVDIAARRRRALKQVRK